MRSDGIGAKEVVLLQSGCFRERLLYSGKSGCTRTKRVVVGQRGCNPSQVVVLGQKFCIRAK